MSEKPKIGPQSTQPDGQVNIGLRVPARLKARLQEAADREHRSLSLESERRLERSFDSKALFVDALNAIGPSRNPLGAGAYIRTLLDTVYGPQVGGLGQMFMTSLALLRFAGSSGMRVKVQKVDLDALKAAIREIEKGADLTHGKD